MVLSGGRGWTWRGVNTYTKILGQRVEVPGDDRGAYARNLVNVEIGSLSRVGTVKPSQKTVINRKTVIFG